MAAGWVAIAVAVVSVASIVPGWLWLVSLGWLRTYVLLPLVAFGLGRRLIGS